MDKKKQLLYHTGPKTVSVTIRAPKLSKYKISNVFKYIKVFTNFVFMLTYLVFVSTLNKNVCNFLVTPKTKTIVNTIKVFV